MMRHEHGFTLVELAVTLAVFAVVSVLAVPSVARWAANARVRSTAEALQNSLRLAQAEALRRNRQTVFALTDDTPGMAARPVNNGALWFVRALPALAAESAKPSDYVEGSPMSRGKVRITGPALICFNAIGWQVVNTTTDMSADCLADDVTYIVAGTGIADRQLHVQVSFAGRIRMCDPNRSLAAGDPDGC